AAMLHHEAPGVGWASRTAALLREPFIAVLRQVLTGRQKAFIKRSSAGQIHVTAKPHSFAAVNLTARKES
ncbi:MAG: hypothetical protein L0H29_11495, partial [Sinobacteraceae bacterium]|nr:hypothetical protein [Nevskiaceae bacterium]